MGVRSSPLGCSPDVQPDLLEPTLETIMRILLFVLIVVYAGGVWKFWQGFHRTSFERGIGNQIALSLMWPVLYIGNKSYRQNFTKALKGR